MGRSPLFTQQNSSGFEEGLNVGKATGKQKLSCGFIVQRKMKTARMGSLHFRSECNYRVSWNRQDYSISTPKGYVYEVMDSPTT